MADQDKPGQQQVFWQTDRGWGGVVDGFEWGASGKNALKIRQKRRRRRFWRTEELAWQNELGAEHCFCG